MDWLAGLPGRLAVWQAGSLAGGRFGCQAEDKLDKLVKTFLIHFKFY